MTRRVIGIPWFSASIAVCVALFLVAIAPACSFGAKARAASSRLVGVPANPNGPSEEEREDDPPRIKTTRQAASPSTIPARPAPPRHIAAAALASFGRTAAPRISRAVLPWLHHARFSERRLI